LAEKIDELIFKNNILEQMSKNIYQNANQFLWSKRADFIYSKIESEINNRQQ